MKDRAFVDVARKVLGTRPFSAAFREAMTPTEMSHPSKAKGNGFEREIVNIVNARPTLEAERAYASNGKALGEAETVDVVINQDLPKALRWWSPIRVQAKRRKVIPAWMKIPAGADIVVVREDRGTPLAVLPLSDYLDLLERA